MVNDFGEAVGTILGMAFAGFILISIGQGTNSTPPVNFEAWGRMLIVMGAGTGMILILGLLKTLGN